MKKKNNQNNCGFSLIEVILYVAITSLFLLAMTNFIWDIIYGRQKAHAHQVVEQSARFAVSRINYEVRQASSFTIVNSTSLQLTNVAGTTSIFLDGTTLKITLPGGGSYDLTSNEVAVSSLNFTELSIANSNSKQLGVELVLNKAQAGNAAAHDATISISESIELKSSFNQSRNLLIDLSNVAPTPNNKSILGITLENTGSTDLVITQLVVEWTGISNTVNIENIQIAGSSQWTGSQPSGSTLDLSDYVLSSAAGIINLDTMDFDAKIDGGTFLLKFILSDGSVAEARFSIQTAGNPTPTPSPTTFPTPTPASTPTPTTPPPPSSCNQYCQQNNNSSGVCRKNAKACKNAEETNFSGGNYLCTGGKNADTCCCLHKD